MARGPVGGSAEGQRRGSGPLPPETGGKTATEGGDGAAEEGEGPGENRWCEGEVEVQTSHGVLIVIKRRGPEVASF